ncbi:MAG: YraN family protein [Anaerolineae bacterium]
MAPSQSTGDYKQQLGRRGEEIATSYLQKQGYAILARNWKCPIGEIDIVARERETLAFVEATKIECTHSN